MNKKDMVKKALEIQDEGEEFNKALARAISERKHGKVGYKKYMDLIEEIRKISREKETSIEKAAKEYLNR